MKRRWCGCETSRAADRAPLSDAIPPAARHGDFWLLSEMPPGPVRPSLAKPGLQAGLLRGGHVDGEPSADVQVAMEPKPRLRPGPSPSSPSSLRVAGLQGCATSPQLIGSLSRITLVPPPRRPAFCFISSPSFSLCLHSPIFSLHVGSVAEWSKAPVLGTGLVEAWVRIPPLSLVIIFFILNKSINASDQPSILQCLQCRSA